MATLASNLLDFILGLLGDDEKAAAFSEDPEGTLAAADLDDLCLADFPNVMNLLQYTPGLALNSSSVAPGTTATSAAPVAGVTLPPTAATVLPGTQVSPVSRGETEEDGVIEQLQYIQRTYTYNATNVEVRDNVWAGQDVYALFGDDSVLAAPGGFAVGGGIEDAELEFEDSFNPVSTTVNGDGNALGEDSEVDNTDNSINVDDANGVNIGSGEINGDAVSGVGNVVGNDIEDSGNDNSDNSTNLDIEDSGNDNSDNSTNLDVRNSGNDSSDNSDRSITDNSDNSITDNSDNSISDDDEWEFEVGDVEVVTGDNSSTGPLEQEDNDEFTNVSENIVVADNEVDADDISA